MILSALDHYPLALVFASLVLILLIAAEIGFYLGQRRRQKIQQGSKLEEQQTAPILAAALGLLAFLLAFTFNIANSTHTERKALVLKEANAIGTLYLRSQLFENQAAQMLQTTLGRYVELRIEVAGSLSNTSFTEGLAESDRLLEEIWQSAAILAQNHPSPMGALLVTATNDVIDIHAERVNGVYKRLPLASIFILQFIAVLSLALMGYQSGLNGARVWIPRSALILAFATVMVVIADLDRPGGQLIDVSQRSMLSLQQQMQKTE